MPPPTSRAPKPAAKILVVEDNAINALVARKQFAQLGYDIIEAANGREAIEAVERELFDVIFMDCHMPELDGFEATAAIRAREASANRVPIVAMTADARNEDRQRCLVAGMDDYITKPTSLAALQAMLDRWLADTSDTPAKVVQSRRFSGRRS